MKRRKKPRRSVAELVAATINEADRDFVREVYAVEQPDLRALDDEYRDEIPPDAPGYVFSGEYWDRYYALFKRKTREEEQPGVVPWNLPAIHCPRVPPRPIPDQDANA